MESRVERAQGYRKEAEKYAELASSGQRDITSFARKRVAEKYFWMAEDLERRENLTQTLVTLLCKRE
jgi:hypothetical protein